ncbi:MAG: hypothetical protein K2W96_27300 [Gemmataceae bacterium]|nr:hypothetical protein [Gemmataceae bacterium]
MIVFQACLLAFGILGGALAASYLRRVRWGRPARLRAIPAFTAGAAAWVAFALISLSGPIAWTFLGTVLAIYLPCLIELAAPEKAAIGSEGRDPDPT